MAPFDVTALGVGDSFSERHNPSALLLEHGGFRLAVDCPDMYRRVLAGACSRVSASEVDHVLITHLHGDHVNGLEGLAFFKHFVDGRRLALLASPDVLEVIWNERLAASMSRLFDGHGFREMTLTDYFEPCALSWDQPTELGPFRIRTRRTRHHIPTTALLVEAGGRTLGYSADTAFDPSLIDFLAPADLIIHETNLGPAHTPYERLAELPISIRSKMRLIHYPDSFDCALSNIRTLDEGEALRI